MKKFVVFMLSAVLVFSICTESLAQKKWKVGVHGAYSTGGDVEESEFGFGGQVEIGINPSFSMELAVSSFSDGLEDDLLKIDQNITTFGLSAIWKNRMPGVTFFMLAGLNYNLVSMDMEANAPGVSLDVEIDDSLGTHLGWGLDFPITQSTGLFLEYRYTVLELDTKVRGTNSHSSMSDKITGNKDEMQNDKKHFKFSNLHKKC